MGFPVGSVVKNPLKQRKGKESGMEKLLWLRQVALASLSEAAMTAGMASEGNAKET